MLLIFLIHIILLALCQCGDYLINITFGLNIFSLFIISYLHLVKEKIFSPYITSYIVFGYLFFFIAPISQVYSGIFPNNYPINPIAISKLNVYIFIWNIIFLYFYQFFKKKYNINNISFWTINENKSKNNPLYIISLLIIVFLIVFSQIDYIMDKLIFHDEGNIEFSIMKKLIINKTLFTITLSGLIFSLIYLKNRNNLNINFLLISISFIFFFLLFVLVKNPMIEKRNALGPLFITLLIFSKPILFNSNKKIFSFLFGVMVIIFPLASILTHSRSGLKSILNTPSKLIDNIKSYDILGEFNTLHYDAYSNALATMDFVSNHGITYGKQFIGGIFFFIPRSIWDSKPESTGKFIGQYLMSNYKMWFDNLSNPFLSEGIINFGFLGIIIFPILLAWFITKMLQWQYSNDLLKQIVAIYFSIHLIFFLRGDFTNGWAYFVGTFIGIYIIPKIIIHIINSLPKKKTTL